MAFIPVPNTAAFKLFIDTATLRSSIGLYFHRVGFNAADLDALLAALESEFITDLMSHLDEAYEAKLAVAYDLGAEDGYKSTRTLDIAGGIVGATTPMGPATSMVVSFYGNKRGKWNQGRVYVPGLTEQDVDQVDIEDVRVGEILEPFQALIGDPPDGWTWVVVSRYFQGEPREEGVTIPVASVISRDPRPGYQRRRARRS